LPVLRALDDGEVERAVLAEVAEVALTVAGRVPGLRRLRHALGVLGRGALRGESRGAALDDAAQLAELLVAFDGDRRDRVAAVGREHDQALEREPVEGLTQGSPGDLH